MSINLSAEAAQTPIAVNLTGMWKFGFYNTKVCLLEQVNESKVRYPTWVRDHMLNCDHALAWEDFSIIGRESNHYLLETKESLFIKRDNTSLNRNKYSRELFLF